MTDLAEFLGTVLALYLLFGIPLLVGTFISVLDVILIFGVTGGRIRRIEYLFMGFISSIGLRYIYEIFITHPSITEIVAGSLTPS
jgi:manganese transport protein